MSDDIQELWRLPEDVWCEILRRLPLKEVFKLRCVSKLWHSLLTRTFNIFTRWTLFHGFQSFESPEFISDHDDNDGFSFSFLFEKLSFNYNGLGPEKLYLLASSNGLVLCSTLSNYYCSVIKYYVANPLTKDWVLLPPPQNPSNYNLIGFVCEPSSSSSLISTSSSSTYKVVIIPQISSPTRRFNVEIFSSDFDKWNIYEVSCPQEVMWEHPKYSNVVIHNGVMCWLEGQGNRIIVYNLNDKKKKKKKKKKKTKKKKKNCRLIDLPEGDDENCCRFECCLGVREGFICYGVIQKKQILKIWVLKEDYSNNGGWVWQLVHKTDELKNMLLRQLKEGEWKIQFMIPLGFNPVDQNIVIFLDFPNYILAFNIRTRRFEVHLPTATPLELENPLSSGFRFSSRTIVVTPRPTMISHPL